MNGLSIIRTNNSNNYNNYGGMHKMKFTQEVEVIPVKYVNTKIDEIIKEYEEAIKDSECLSNYKITKQCRNEFITSLKELKALLNQ